jgi:hypothetical protein
MKCMQNYSPETEGKNIFGRLRRMWEENSKFGKIV